MNDLADELKQKLYYLPFYFQAARGTSAIRSGVNYIALAVPQFVALLGSGGLVTRFDDYVRLLLKKIFYPG